MIPEDRYEELRKEDQMEREGAFDIVEDEK